VKLHTLKQSLLLSLWSSLLSVSTGADRLDTEQSEPAGMGVIATMNGSQVVAEPNRAPITNDTEFMEAVNAFGEIQPLTEEVMKRTLLLINGFLNIVLDEIPEKVCKEILGQLGLLTGIIDETCTHYMEKELAGRIIEGPDEVTNFYKSSGLVRIIIYLQQLTQGLLKKINKKYPKLFRKIENIKFLEVFWGTLFILSDDSKKFVPVFIPKAIIVSSQCLAPGIAKKDKVDIIYTPYYGVFPEGVLSRGFVYSNSKLMDKAGVFLEYYNSKKGPICSITIYAGCQKGITPLLVRTVNIIQESLESHPAFESFKKELPKLRSGEGAEAFKGKFISMSDTVSIHRIEGFLLECAFLGCTQQEKNNTLFVPILSLFAELISREEVLKEAIAQKKLDSKKSNSKSKKTKGKEMGAQPSLDADFTMKNDDESAIPEDEEIKKTLDSVVPVNTANSDKAEVEKLVTIETAFVLSTAEHDDNDQEVEAPAPEVALEAPLTKEQIHQSLYDQVMATVPAGRIHQRVLDRLISEWLNMTQIPIHNLQVFGRGSHRSIHGVGGGLTTVNRHGSDPTYAPGEVRKLAKKVVELAAQ